MGYLHISNLYRDQKVLNFKRVFCMEKIHGTSAHISWDGNDIRYFSGGEKHENFISLFNHEELLERFKKLEYGNVTFYGEAYGGKCQGMSSVYGSALKFVVFDVKIGDRWLPVNKAEKVSRETGFDFVPYEEVECTIEELDKQRDRQSEQAIKNGMGDGKWREGIVIRPIMEACDEYGERIIAKHKRTDARETKTERKVDDPGKLAVLTEAKAIAEEWVTVTRLEHVLDKLQPDLGIEQVKLVIDAMYADIKRESDGEIVWSKEAVKQVNTATGILFKKRLQNRIGH
jgi:hypothetical protein